MPNILPNICLHWYQQTEQFNRALKEDLPLRGLLMNEKSEMHTRQIFSVLYHINFPSKCLLE